MKIQIFRSLSILIISLFYASLANASIQELITNAKFYDSQIISVEGEVVGDVMNRKEGVWINIFDGSAAIGIFADKSLVPNIVRRGDYLNTGDILRVEGRFNRADPDHGGDLDIAAQKIDIIKEGTPTPRPANTYKLHLLLVLIPFVILLMLFRPR